MRNSKEVSKEEYNEFYKKAFNEFLDPLAHTHFTTEVLILFKLCISPNHSFVLMMLIVCNLTVSQKGRG